MAERIKTKSMCCLQETCSSLKEDTQTEGERIESHFRPTVTKNKRTNKGCYSYIRQNRL